MSGRREVSSLLVSAERTLFRILNRFLNCAGRELTLLTEAFYPLAFGIRGSVFAEDFRNLDEIWRQLSALGIASDAPLPTAWDSYRPRCLPKLVACHYSHLEAISAQPEPAKSETLRLHRRRLSEVYPDTPVFVRPAFSLERYVLRELADYLVVGGVHGSIGTADYVEGNSDLDTVFIVKGKALRSARAVSLLQKKCFLASASLDHDSRSR